MVAATAHKLLVVGAAGFLGVQVVKEAQQSNFFSEVGACTEKGFLDVERDLGGYAKWTHILCCIPPDRDKGRDHFLDKYSTVLLSNETNTAPSCNLQWMGYISSTGVYGEAQGQWVTEEAVPQPISAKAQARRKAENHYISVFLGTNVKLRIFRLAGLYGPGRNALQTLLKNQLPVSEEEQDYVVSRIHVHDAARILILCIMNDDFQKTSSFLEILNLADTEPTSKIQIQRHCRYLLRLDDAKDQNYYGKATTNTAAAATHASSARGGGNKRVSSKKLQNLLKKYRTWYLYPTYREGYQHCLSSLI